MPGAERVRALADWLASRKAVALAAFLGMTLVLPSLSAGLISDDYWQLLMVAAGRPAWDLFHFVPAGSGGGGPLWIADPGQTIAFFRPLPSLLHYVEYRYFSELPALMHGHSILWYGLTIGVVGLLFREIGQREWTAGLATILFAVNANHGEAVGWIASRGALISVASGAVTLLLHHRWRSQGGRYGFLAIGSFIVVLLTGEPGLTITGYLLAYALCLDRSAIRSRVLSVVPYLALAASWWLVTRAWGYGVRDSGFYVGADGHTLGSAIVVVRHAIIMIFMHIGWPWLDALSASDPGAWIVASFTLAAFAVSLFFLARRKPAIGMWALGAALSAIPLGFGIPQRRMLMPMSLGMVFLPPLLLSAAVGSLPAGKRWGVIWAGASWCGAYLSLAWLLIGVLLLPAASVSMAATYAPHQEFAATLDARRDQVALVLNAPDLHMAPMTRAIRSHRGLRVPRGITILSAGGQRVTVERIGPNRLRLRGFPDLFGVQARALRTKPFQKGDRFDLSVGSAEVVGVNAYGGAEVIDFSFPYLLDSRHLAFFTTVRATATPVTIPEPGRRLVLEGYAPPREEEEKSAPSRQHSAPPP